MDNILNIDNWIIVGLAILKMAYYFWPVIILFLVFMWYTPNDLPRLGIRPIDPRERKKAK